MRRYEDMKRLLKAAVLTISLLSVSCIIYKLCSGRYWTAPMHDKKEEDELNSFEDDMCDDADD